MRLSLATVAVAGLAFGLVSAFDAQVAPPSYGNANNENNQRYAPQGGYDYFSHLRKRNFDPYANMMMGGGGGYAPQMDPYGGMMGGGAGQGYDPYMGFGGGYGGGMDMNMMMGGYGGMQGYGGYPQPQPGMQPGAPGGAMPGTNSNMGPMNPMMNTNNMGAMGSGPSGPGGPPPPGPENGMYANGNQQGNGDGLGDPFSRMNNGYRPGSGPDPMAYVYGGNNAPQPGTPANPQAAAAASSSPSASPTPTRQ